MSTDLKYPAVRADPDPVEIANKLAVTLPWPNDCGDAHGSIQWKGTVICLDFYCECGSHGHVDADFAYYVECGACHAIFALNVHVKAHRVKIDRSEWPQPHVDPVLAEVDPEEIIDASSKDAS